MTSLSAEQQHHIMRSKNDLLQLENTEFKLHNLSHDEGGIIMNDQENIIPQAIYEVMCKLTKRALSGQVSEMWSIPSPAYLHYPLSILNFIQNDCSYAPLLQLASQQKDPMQRMKYVISFYVGAHFINPSVVSCRAPLNPILGETLQRELEDSGDKLYCEQISHHPPISAYQLCGPDDCYILNGYHTCKGWFNGVQSLGGCRVGKMSIEFKDGVKYIFDKQPTMSIENIMQLQKRQLYYDEAIITDQQNKIQAIIKYNPNFNQGITGVGFRYTLGWIPGMNNLGKNKYQERKARSDDIQVQILDLNNENKIVSEGGGSWLSHLIIDDEIIWKIEDTIPKWKDDGELLKSDSRLRIDVNDLIEQNWEQAEAKKLELEEFQRADKKLREKAAEYKINQNK